MAFLLLLHQKMSLQRKVNKLNAENMSISGAKERITKRIQDVQGVFTKREERIDSQAKLMTSHTNNMVSQMLAQQNYSMGNITPEEWLRHNNPEEFKNYQAKQKAGGQEFQDYLRSQVFYDAQTNATQYNNRLSMQKQIVNQNMNTFQTNVQDKVSIWVDTQKQALEEEEQLALAPLNEQETLIDIKLKTNETLLTYNKERLQNITSALDENLRDSAPKFGA